MQLLTTSHTHTVPSGHFQFALTVLLLLIHRVLLVREESRDPLEVLDSRVFQDPRVPLVRVESLENRY